MARILAFDYGTKRIGIASTDPLQIIANSLDTVHPKDVVVYLKKYMTTEPVEAFVVGLPRTLQNEESSNAANVKAFINLIKNAKEALEHTAGGVIHIKTFAQNQWLFIEITDNGPGIEPEAMEDIFIPFFTTKENGSGIGLSLSRQIVQQHGGTIKVFSESGKGSRFVVQLKIKVVGNSAGILLA